MLDSLVFFLILWVALMPDRLGYDGGMARPGAARKEKVHTLLHLHLLPSQKLE